ncbi:MAG TPA: sigma-70 family RNA polymerase sigma factor [Thermoanaerobaculia bacterium]|nr:sigma-70 family RNA polymerase sigma factor [Thermoanaerobaculia bacterium]
MIDERHNLYQEHYVRLVRYLVARWEFTTDEAREIAQDVFVRVLSRRKEDPAIVATWPFLKAAAHNQALNVIRSRTIRGRSGGESIDDKPELKDAALREIWNLREPRNPEEETSEKEQSLLLRNAISKLSPALRACLLQRLSGRSYEEIATTLQITPNAVKTRLRDAKKLLQARLGSGD